MEFRLFTKQQIAHAPLALLRMVPGCLSRWKGRDTLVNRGLQPVYVTMIREPFARFTSEVDNFGGHHFRALDWAAVVDTLPRDRTKSVPFTFDRSKWVFYPGVAPMKKLRATLAEVAALPRELILHNRYTKMIGGEEADFDFGYSNDKLGSLWRNVSSSKIRGLKRPLARSLRMLLYATDVVPLLFERFAESLCVMEVVWGNSRQFAWDPDNHAHNKATSWSSNSSNITLHQDPEAYELFAARNEADLFLYQEAVVIFDIQLTVALELLASDLRLGVGAGMNQSQATSTSAPHCVPFLQAYLQSGTGTANGL